jgi:hypothetical protein
VSSGLSRGESCRIGAGAGVGNSRGAACAVRLGDGAGDRSGVSGDSGRVADGDGEVGNVAKVEHGIDRKNPRTEVIVEPLQAQQQELAA